MSSDAWQVFQQAYLKPGNTDVNDTFGYAVAIDGDTMVVGAPLEDSNATGINGNQANDSASNAGAAYVFVRDGTTWTQQAYLKASNAEAGDQFGISVAIDGDTIVVGAYWEASTATGVNGNQASNGLPYAGAAYVFVRSGATWSQQAYLKASNTDDYDKFGIAVAVDGDTIAVTANEEDSNATGIDGSQSSEATWNAGAAYFFVRSGSTWSQQAYVKASNTGEDHYFGNAVSIDGDTVVVGAADENSDGTGVNGAQNNNAGNRGAAYVFSRSGATWSQQAYLKASNTALHFFGQSVSVDGDTVVVGADYEDSNATGINGDQNNSNAANSGAAYVFVRSATTWAQQAYLKASNTGVDDHFGYSVGIDGYTIVVGARHEDSSAIGVNGMEANNSLADSGAAYVFLRNGNGWSQQAYVKPSNTGASDQFGAGVALDGDTIVIGADDEASAATGVNGDEGNNSAGDSGAAYALRLQGHALVIRLDALPPGDANCSAGGTRVSTGLDDGSGDTYASDMVLDAEEVEAVQYACSGASASGTGPTGPSGPSGAAGSSPSGPTGATGAVGVRGASGPPGATGVGGIVGGAGAAGSSGPAGAAGAEGSSGPAGPAGALGTEGGVGATGPTGPVGEDGSTAAMGPAGPMGPEGEQGQDGAPGPSGPSGAAGADGTSCSIVDSDESGTTLLCTDETTAVFQEGLGGAAADCTVQDPGDDTRVITCSDGTSITVEAQRVRAPMPAVRSCAGVPPALAWVFVPLTIRAWRRSRRARRC